MYTENNYSQSLASFKKTCDTYFESKKGISYSWKSKNIEI